MIKVLRQVPWSGKYFLFYNPGNQLFSDLSLLRAELIGSIGYLISISYVSNPDLLKHLFTILCTFILAYVLRGYQLSKLLIFVFLGERTSLIAIYLDMNLFYDLFEDLIINVGEELIQLKEADSLILLQKAYDIGLSSSLNEMLISTALGVVDLHVIFWFYLAHEVHFLDFPHKDLALTLFILVDHT